MQVRRYGPSAVHPAVTPAPAVNRASEATFAALEEGFASVNKFLRPAVTEIQARRGTAEANQQVAEKGPEFRLNKTGGETSTIALNAGSKPEGTDLGRPNLKFSMGPKRPEKPNEALLNILGETAREVLGEKGTVRITSGKGEYGSSRHRGGHAADVQFIDADGNLVSLNDARSTDLAAAAARRGITGFGAGSEYMGDHTFHMDIFPTDQYTPDMARTWGSFGKKLGKLFSGEPVHKVAVEGTPEYELQTVNKNTFEPRLPFTVRDQAFNAAADRAISAKAMAALEMGITNAQSKANGDLGVLRAEMERVRNQVMAEVPKEMPGLATELQASFDRASAVAQTNAVQIMERRVIAQQKEAAVVATTAIQQEAERLAITGASGAQIAAHLAQSQEALVQFGPREAFTMNGKRYEADPKRAGILSGGEIGIAIQKIEGSAREVMIEGEFQKSAAPGAFVEELRRAVFAGEGPLPTVGENLQLLAKLEARAARTESERRTAANAEKKRLLDETKTTINNYVEMTEAGVPVAIPQAERTAILGRLSPYPELQREAEIAFAVADAAVETHGMTGPDLVSYAAKVREDIAAGVQRGEMDLEGVAVIHSLQDRLKKVQDAVTAETLGLPLLEQLAKDGQAPDQVDWDAMRARAAGKPELLEEIGEVEAFYKQAASMEAMNAEEREEVLTATRNALRNLAAQGDAYGAGAAKALAVTEKLAAFSEKRKDLAANDAVAYAQSVGVALPSFEGAETMQDMGSVIAQRVNILAPRTEGEGVPHPVPLTAPEIAAISEIYKGASRNQRMQFLASVADLGSEQADRIFTKIGASEPSLYAAGRVFIGGNQQAAGVILQGAVDAKLGGGSIDDVAQARSSEIGELLREGIIGAADIKVLDDTALAYARGKALADGGRPVTTRDLQEGFRVAVGGQEDGTGGVASTSYGTTLLPKGWTGRKLTRAIDRLTEDSLTEMIFGTGAKGAALVVDAYGRPFNVNSLRDTIEGLRPHPEDDFKFIPVDSDGGVFIVDDGVKKEPLVFDLRRMKVE